jgi:hypothetical protein
MSSLEGHAVCLCVLVLMSRVCGHSEFVEKAGDCLTSAFRVWRGYGLGPFIPDVGSLLRIMFGLAFPL